MSEQYTTDNRILSLHEAPENRYVVGKVPAIRVVMPSSPGIDEPAPIRSTMVYFGLARCPLATISRFAAQAPGDSRSHQP